MSDGHSQGPGLHGGGPKDPERTIDAQTAPMLAGGDTRLPAAAVNDERALARINLKALTQTQRAAAQMMGRMRRLKLLGPNAETAPEERDQVGIQILIEMANTIRKVEDIDTSGDDVATATKVHALSTHVNALKNLADTHTRLLAEMSKITDLTQRALGSMARLELERSKAKDNPDNLSDAELAG